MSSERAEFSEDKTEFRRRQTNAHLLLSEHRAPKGTSSPFIWTLSTPALLCVKMRAGIQKTCTDGASSLPASPSPSPSPPSQSFKSSTGLRRRGSWVSPPSHPLMLPLFFCLSLPPPLLPPPPPPVLGKAGARRQAVLFLQRIDLTLPRLCFGC